MTDSKLAAGAPGVPVQIKIELDPETAQGVYINMAMINHSETEFTLDFVFVQPQEPKGKVRSRVISSPKHLKRLFVAMQEAINSYERKFGTIEVPSGPGPFGPMVN